jgi:hypothetical protein
MVLTGCSLGAPASTLTACLVSTAHPTSTAAPAGHYVLNLSCPAQWAIADRLREVARTTEPPGALPWINVLYDEYVAITRFPPSCGTPEAWGGHIPSTGILTFDYVTTLAPQLSSSASSDEELARFLEGQVRGSGGWTARPAWGPESGTPFLGTGQGTVCFLGPTVSET